MDNSHTVSIDANFQLLASTTRSAIVRRTRTQFGRHAFSVSGPDVWNSLSHWHQTHWLTTCFPTRIKGSSFNVAFN